MVTTFIAVTVSIITASTLLFAEIETSHSAVFVVRAVIGGLLALVGGVLTNYSIKVVRTIWRRPGELNDSIANTLTQARKRLRRPAQAFGVVVVAAAVVTLGLLVRPPATVIEPGPIVVMTAFGGSPNDPRQVLFGQWNQLHPDSPVDLEHVTGLTDEQHAAMVTDARPGGKHKADVYDLDVVWMPEFVERDYVREVDEASLSDHDDFVPQILRTCRYDGRLWGVPFNTDVGLLYYRSDVPGVTRPKRWADYFGSAARAAVTDARSHPAGRGVEAANAAQLADTEMLTITALEAIWAAGGDVVDKDGQVLLNADGSEVYFGREDRAGIANLATAATDPDLVLTGNDEARNATENQATESFALGRTLFMRNWPVARDAVGEKVRFDVSAPPTPSVLGGQNLAIASATDRPRAAQALIDFLTSPSSQVILAEVGGYAPVRYSAYSNPGRPNSQEILAAVQAARLRPVTPAYTHFSKAFRKGIIRALNSGGKLEPEFPRELAAVLAGG